MDFESTGRRFEPCRACHHGKELHKKYFDAAKAQDLRAAAENLLALKNHRLKGCIADSEMVKAARKGIVDSARYFVNGFDASQEEKQKVVSDLGLDTLSKVLT